MEKRLRIIPKWLAPAENLSKPTPFTARRDPKTGRWEIIQPSPRKQTRFLGKLQTLASISQRNLMNLGKGLRIQA